MAKFSPLPLLLLLLLLTASPASPKQSRRGRFLLYAPMMSRSMKMTLTPLAEELARRGHRVTLVTPFEHSYQGEGAERIEVIQIHSTFQEVLDDFSR